MESLLESLTALALLLLLGFGYLHQYRQKLAATRRDEADHVAPCCSASVLASADLSQAG